MAAFQRWTPSKGRVEALLGRSPNRNLVASHVKRLALAMGSGNWNPAVSPILFYPDGALADGQHRLSAWIEAGCPSEVCFYAATINGDEITKVDAGRLRNTRDHCKILGLSYGHRDLAAARVALCLELNRSYDPALLTATHEMLIDAARRYDTPSFVNRIMPASVAGALAFIGDRRGVRSFYDKVVHGENLTRTHPAYHLRSLCMQSTFSNRNNRAEWTYKTIRAWNAYAKGEQIGQLKAGSRPYTWLELESLEAASLASRLQAIRDGGKEAKDGALLPR